MRASDKKWPVQKFVETEEGVEAGLAISQEDLNRRKSKTSMNPVKSYDVRRGSIQSWNGSDDSARQSRWVPKVIKPRPFKFLLFGCHIGATWWR